MKLDYDDSIFANYPRRYLNLVDQVADALERQANEIRARLRRVPAEADYHALTDLAIDVLQIVDNGHSGLTLYHTVFGSLQDVLKAHQALDINRQKAEEELERLDAPPTDHWDYLQRISDDRGHQECRIRQGSRWHTGTLTGMRIRDSRRAAKSQYVTISQHNVDTLEFKVGARYVPFKEAFPLEGWTPPMKPCGNRGGEQMCAADDPTRCSTHHDRPEYHRSGSSSRGPSSST